MPSFHPSSWRWFLRGFLVGVLTPSFYLALGGEYIWGVPTWVLILFYPGFKTGHFVYEYIDWMGMSREVACAVGCIAVGITYGLLALGTAYLIKRSFSTSAAVQPKNQSK
jgi:hypothetical protein